MGYVSNIVFGLPAKLMNAARVARFRISGAQIGTKVQIGRDVRISGVVRLGDGARISNGVALEGKIRIGCNSWVQKQVEVSGNVEIGDGSVIGAFSAISTMPTGHIRIGHDVLVNMFSVVGANECVEIGDHCIFAAFVQITDSIHGIERPEELIKHAPWRSAPVHIGENVWLGSAAMVTMGVSIGAGSVIGAKALVNDDVPPMSVAYGMPARVVRNRLKPLADAVSVPDAAQ